MVVHGSFSGNDLALFSHSLAQRARPLDDSIDILLPCLPNAPNACLQSQQDDAKRKQELHKNTEESLFYDAIATEAARRQWFDTSLFERHVVHTALRDFFEVKLQGDPIRDIPLVCPNRTELDILLERSLVKEQQILSPLIAQSMRQAHMAGFQKAVEQNKFCWIDVEKAMENPIWRRFFEMIVPEK